MNELGCDIRQEHLRLFGAVFVLVSLFAGSAGCSLKKTVRVQVPGKIRMAKTASFEELVELVNSYSERVQSISSTSMRVTFTSGKPESGKLQEYRSAPGYMLLRRPDSIRMTVQNPLTRTSILDLASQGDAFSIWIPRDNKFYVGRNSAREFEVEGDGSAPKFTARPIQILQAILPSRLPLGGTGFRISLEEAQDATTKYYVLSLYKDDGDSRLLPVRKFWVDRADLTIARLQTYEIPGEIESVIDYADFITVAGVRLPLAIKIDRPLDGYALDLQFKDWRLNPEFPEGAFVLTPPPGAQRIQLKERETSKEP